jgi:hypothetical protein
MFRRQLININTIRRYSHQHCEKNIPQINCNNFCENNEKKIDLIQKQLLEDNEKINVKFNIIQNSIGIVFSYSIISTFILTWNIV